MPSFEGRFANAFAEYNGVPYCVPTTNGSAALVLALEALGIGNEDEVIVPGLAWVACASAVLRVGGVPVLADHDSATLQMSCSDGESKITARTRGIIVEHLYSSLADLDRFLEISRKRNLPIIEDCSHVHGAEWMGRKAGTLGSIGVFSMQQTKILTSGEGGATITKSPKLFAILEQLRADGRRVTANSRIGCLELEEVGAIQGYNHSLSEFHSAILLDRLDHLDSENATRSRNVRVLEQILGDSNLAHLPERDPRVTKDSIYRICLRLGPPLLENASAQRIAQILTAELGIDASPIYRPLESCTLYRPQLCRRLTPELRYSLKYDPESHDLPGAQEAYRQYISLPHQILLGGEEDLMDIHKALKKVWNCVGKE